MEYLEQWTRLLPVLKDRINAQFDEFERLVQEVVRSKDVALLVKLEEAVRALRVSVQDALEQLGASVPAIARPNRVSLEKYDTYLTDRQILEQTITRRLAAVTVKFDDATRQLSSSNHRLRQVKETITSSADAYHRILIEQRDTFDQLCHLAADTLAFSWLEDQEKELSSILTSRLGDDPAAAVVQDETNASRRQMEEALLLQQNKLRNVYLPFWSSVQSHMRSLETAEGGELVIGELNRELERQFEHVRQLAELAQIGLVVEATDHDYYTYFQKLGDTLDLLTKKTRVDATASLVDDVRTGFQNLEMQLRLLSPLLRRRTSRAADVTGEQIRDFIERWYPQNARYKTEIVYSELFLKLRMRSVNVPVVLGASANLVNNSLYWATQTPPPHRIKFTVVPKGFCISDSGPGVAPRDRERVFDPQFSRRPEGRGLGLYIARNTLAASGLELSLASEMQKSALPGANFLVVQRAAQ